MQPKTNICIKDRDKRFKVNSKEFRGKDMKWTRIRLCTDGRIVKSKPEQWSDEANMLWDKIIATACNYALKNL